MTNIINPTKNLELKKRLRKNIIEHRSNLSEKELANRTAELTNVAIGNHAFFQTLCSASTILSYVPFNGEISPLAITESLSAQVYLPKIIDYANYEMAFFSSQESQIKNRYGISEPTGQSKSLEIDKFDIIFIPLVGFDLEGNRLGLGAGFYDRAISKVFNRPELKDINRPLLIGLAHDFQQQPTIPTDVWDVPLDVILTNQKIINVTNQIHC